MFDVADRFCPEQRQMLEKRSPSRRTLARRMKAIGEDLTSQLKGLVPSFQMFSWALDESTDIADTVQLLNLVRGIPQTLRSPKNCSLWNQ